MLVQELLLESLATYWYVVFTTIGLEYVNLLAQRQEQLITEIVAAIFELRAIHYVFTTSVTYWYQVLEQLDVLRKKTDAQPEEVIGIEKLIAEAYSVIDKANQVGTLHRNTGTRRKS
ncbi:ribosomal protein S20 [Artemisia annua]|uniref:Ribosomal protein S20 n=1 Tax=Artemisia annua TaxID=35608 RepID=A0A2U1N4X9_ARTAN|nr:ribosomal protein S20 [Artemisia annua]